jgi:mono/diheme cytochrome c family protein/plastocyanin
MNTYKQINIMVALIFISVLATGAYSWWDPHRANQAKDKQLESTVERGAFLFSQNCRICHGNEGEGGAASNRLRQAPALNRPDLQGKDPTTGEVTEQSKAQAFKLVTNTITCGRIGKAMPTWGQSQGGSLNDEQIRQLATFITEGTGWEEANVFGLEGVPKFDVHGDLDVPFSLVAPIGEADTRVSLSDVSTLGVGDRLQFDEEIMSITAVDKDANTVTVERGIGTTKPEAHGLDSVLLKPPVPPDPAPITQPACGQNLPSEAAAPVDTTPKTELTITAQGIAWSTDALYAVAGVPLKMTVDNKDNGTIHNWVLFQGEDETGPRVAETELEAGPVTQNLDFGPLDPGTYYYHCDVHTNMFGNLTATVAGAAPPAGEAPAAAETPAADDAGSAAATP